MAKVRTQNIIWYWNILIWHNLTSKLHSNSKIICNKSCHKNYRMWISCHYLSTKLLKNWSISINTQINIKWQCDRNEVLFFNVKIAMRYITCLFFNTRCCYLTHNVVLLTSYFSFSFDATILNQCYCRYAYLIHNNYDSITADETFYIYIYIYIYTV